MIKIDDAGTGSSFGKTIIAICVEETNEIFSFTINKNDPKEISDKCLEILNHLTPDKKEKIFVCRGDIFKKLHLELKNRGFEFEVGVVEGKCQDLIEHLFTKQLHDLGFSKFIVLHDKDYRRLELELTDYLYINPTLIKTVRNQTRGIQEVMRKINRLQNEFPNLYKELLNN